MQSKRNVYHKQSPLVAYNGAQNKENYVKYQIKISIKEDSFICYTRWQIFWKYYITLAKQ